MTTVKKSGNKWTYDGIVFDKKEDALKVKRASEDDSFEHDELEYSSEDIQVVYKPKVQRVNVDFTVQFLKELDDFTSSLNISRQAAIKMILRQALDEHYLAKKNRA
ncbi:MAG: hypothetical protein ACOH5I_24835 [Oligoflexus sp.]